VLFTVVFGKLLAVCQKPNLLNNFEMSERESKERASGFVHIKYMVK